MFHLLTASKQQRRESPVRSQTPICESDLDRRCMAVNLVGQHSLLCNSWNRFVRLFYKVIANWA